MRKSKKRGFGIQDDMGNDMRRRTMEISQFRGK